MSQEEAERASIEQVRGEILRVVTKGPLTLDEIKKAFPAGVSSSTAALIRQVTEDLARGEGPLVYDQSTRTYALRTRAA